MQIDIKELISLYGTGISASKLAKQYKVSVWSIITRLNSAGVHIRSNKEQNEKKLNLTEDQKPLFMGIVDGLLLGDGQIDRKGLLRLEQSNVRYCWLDVVTDQLSTIGGTSHIIPIPPRIKIIEGRKVYKKPGSLLYTPAYVELQEQRKRWYPDAEKRVPRNLDLSPLTIAYWFAGDGTCNTNGILVFCTNGFVKEDTEYLAESLCKLDIESNIMNTCREGQFTIGIYKIEDVLRLKDMIEPFLPECCKYKLRFVRSSRKH